MSLTTKQIIRLTDALETLDTDEFDFETVTWTEANELVHKAYALPAITESTPNAAPKIESTDPVILAASEIAAHEVLAYHYQDLTNWYKVNNSDELTENAASIAESHFAKAKELTEFAKTIGLNPEYYTTGLYHAMMKAIRNGEFYWQEVGTNIYTTAQA